MAAVFDTIDEGLSRTSDLIPAATEYYTATWWVYLPTIPTAGVVRTLYMVANSANRSGQSIVIAQNDTGTVYLEVAGVASAGAVIATGWHAVAHTRRALLNFVDVWVDNVQISTASPTITGWTLNELYLGVDPRRTGAAQQVAYFREWPTFNGNWATEAQSPVPVLTADLDTDTPLGTDLLDTTANDHDWAHVGGGLQTFTAAPISSTGAMGGWWFGHAGFAIPITPQTPILRAQTVGGSTPGIIADCWIRMTGSTSEGGVTTASTYDAVLRYWNGTTMVEQTVSDPIADPIIGQSVTPAARSTWALPFRWALVFRCSTWSHATSTFAADGRASLYLNDDLLLTVAGVTIPRRPDGHAIRYTVALAGDCDRIWARTVAEVPPTTDEGAWVGSEPSALVYFDEFESGSYAGWTLTSVFPSGGTPTTPLSYADAGGDDGWGLSIFGAGPTFGSPTAPAVYTGLTRLLYFPPIPTGTPGPGPDPGPGPGPDPPYVAPSYDLDERIIRRLRRAPHLNQENLRVFYRRFELDLERGVGRANGQGADPLVMLRLSRDGGHTWGEPQLMSAGKIGVYTQRVIARRLGQARDTVFEVTVSDPVAWSLVQAWLDLEAGTS